MEQQTIFRWVSVSERMPTKTDYYTCAAGADFELCGQSYFSQTEGTFSNMAISHWQEEVEGIVLSPETFKTVMIAINANKIACDTALSQLNTINNGTV